LKQGIANVLRQIKYGCVGYGVSRSRRKVTVDAVFRIQIVICGAVSFLQGIKTSYSVAKKVMQKPPT